MAGVFKKNRKMETNTQSTNKRIYQLPAIEKIVLDNEISLQLESSSDSPPIPGNESASNLNSFEYFTNDPMKANLG
jgi:hypothetical protein